MSKKIRKVCTMVVIMGVFAGIFTGCSSDSKQTTSGNNTASTADKASESKNDTDSKQGETKERVKISIMGP